MRVAEGMYEYIYLQVSLCVGLCMRVARGLLIHVIRLVTSASPGGEGGRPGQSMPARNNLFHKPKIIIKYATQGGVGGDFTPRSY